MSYDLSRYDPDGEFDRWYTDATGARLRMEFRTLAPRTVLEIGCATGRMTLQLVAAGRRILACTLNEEMVERARERGLSDVEFVCGNVLDMQAMQFEAIVCCSVLHEAPGPGSILRKCHELLAPDGRVFVTVPSSNSIHIDGESPMFSERARRFGVRRTGDLRAWHDLLTDGTGLRVVDEFEFFLKPYPNARMACLSPTIVAHLSKYRGPGGALCWFELDAQ